MTSISRYVRTALLAACAVCAMAAAPASARDFRSTDVQPADYPTVLAVKQMDKLLKEQTGGRLGIKVFAGGSIGTEAENIEQLKSGALEMMRINIALLNNTVPETLVPTLPFIFRDAAHMHAVLDGPIGDEILAAMESQGMVGLAFYDSGSRNMYTVKKPIKNLADLNGLGIRVQQSDMFVAMVKALGATPLPLAYSDVLGALRTGGVDGAENNFPSYETSRHHEVAKFYTLTEHVMAPEVLVFSKEAWDKLSKDDQALVRKAARESAAYMHKLWEEREAKAKTTVEAGGAQIIALENKQEFVDAMKPVYAQFANAPKLQSLVKRVQDTK